MIKTSFIIVAYNEEKTIGRCLDAILSQDGLEDYEIIVVDDGSKDKTTNIVNGYTQKDSRIVLHQLIPNKGRGAARATGVQAAQGEYYAFVDADIVLPKHWLSACLPYMEEYDAVGGIAVPDGDVNYIYTLLDLKPKVANHTTVVSGANGLYKHKIFQVITFDKNFRDGEDVVFNKLMIENGFKTLSIKSLIVEHRESRGFIAALKWLYQSGRGATRQFKQFREIRLPDLAYFTLIGIVLTSLVSSIFLKNVSFLVLPLLFILLVDLVHFQRKFFFELHRSWYYIIGIIVYWIMLAGYFTGRTVGWFLPVPSKQQKKKVMLCFDFEGKWGMPLKEEYDLVKTTQGLLDVLDTYNAKAVFFVVGKIIEEYPDLIKEIAGHGHEIAMHGYAHEYLGALTPEGLAAFDADLLSVEDSLERLIGKRPVGFRSPYLMTPYYYSRGVYRILAAHGYRWVSNREIRYTEELLRPDRIRIESLWGKNNIFTSFMLPILNLQMIFTEHISNKKGLARLIENVTWLNSGSAPFERYDILEVPIHSPLDCDLIGLPGLHEETPDGFIRYTVKTLIGGIKRRGKFYTVTFHDWIIGTSNRIKILDAFLQYLQKDDLIPGVPVPMEIGNYQKSKFKILFITQEFSVTSGGGAGVFAYELCKALAESGLVEVHVLAPGTNTSAREIQEGLILHSCRTISKPLLHIPSFHFQVWRHARKIIRENNINTIHSNNVAGVTVLGVLPSIATIHHPVISELRFTTFIQRLVCLPDVLMEAVVRNRVSQLVVPSNFVKNLLVQINSRLKTKITVSLNGINTKNFKPNSSKTIRETLHVDEKTVMIFFPGGARAKRKGTISLIHALQKLDNSGKYVCVMSGVSREAGWMKELQNEINRSGLAERVMLIGEFSYQDLPKYYTAADFVVYPSLFEGFGLPVLEAMACGKAIIATKTGAAEDIITSGENGILVDIGDEVALAGAIDHLLHNEIERMRLGDAAFQSVQDGYGWDIAAKTVLNMHKDLMSSKSNQ